MSLAVLICAAASAGACAGAAFADAATATAVTTTPTVVTTTVPAPAAPAAKTTSTPTTTTPPATTPPAPAAVKGAARIYLYDAFYIHRKTAITPNRALHVTGVVRPYVAGQKVTLRAWLGKKLISKKTLLVRPMRGGKAGKVRAAITSPAPGILHLELTHKRTAQLLGFAARRGVASLSRSISSGSRGLFVALIQARLQALHFYIPQTGVYDQTMGLAIDAYHRLMHHGTSEQLDGLAASEILAGRGAFPVRYPHDGKHVEGNLGLQLLAEINGNKVYRIYPISSGKPSTPTILGRFRVYQRTPGYLPDGMYYSDFFYGGYAIHGYDPAPDYPASHGCMRLPIIDAISVWNWLSIGVRVDVFY
jgi:hypothetical protein